jgi:hypothetical protein
MVILESRTINVLVGETAVREHWCDVVVNQYHSHDSSKQICVLSPLDCLELFHATMTIIKPHLSM